MKSNYKYTLLAYLTFCKTRIRCGAFKGSIFNLSKRTNVSYNTTRKYVNDLTNLGLVTIKKTKSGAEIISFESLSKATQVLLPLYKSNKYIRFFKNRKYSSYKEIANEIKDQTVLVTLKKQKYFVDKKVYAAKLLKTSRKLSKKESNVLLSSLKHSTQEKVAKGINEYVKTGARHLEKSNGLSKNQNNRILNRLSKSNVIKRDVIKNVLYNFKKDALVDHTAFDYLKATCKSIVIPNKHCIYTVVGSKITFPMKKSQKKEKGILFSTKGYLHGKMVLA